MRSPRGDKRSRTARSSMTPVDPAGGAAEARRATSRAAEAVSRIPGWFDQPLRSCPRGQSLVNRIEQSHRHSSCRKGRASHPAGLARRCRLCAKASAARRDRDRASHPTRFDHLRHPAYVIVVPVGGYDQKNVPGRINAHAFQVSQGSRRPIPVKAGVNEDPCAVTHVDSDALAVAGTEKRDFELVPPGRATGSCHKSSARIVSCAHASPSRRSVPVIAGRSRNTIWETRFFVPAAERS